MQLNCTNMQFNRIIIDLFVILTVYLFVSLLQNIPKPCVLKLGIVSRNGVQQSAGQILVLSEYFFKLAIRKGMRQLVVSYLYSKGG